MDVLKFLLAIAACLGLVALCAGFGYTYPGIVTGGICGVGSLGALVALVKGV